MASAWIFQNQRQLGQHGADGAPYFVGWFDPAGKKRSKSCGAGPDGKRLAEKLRKKREAELITGTYESVEKKVWADFRKEFEERIGERMESRTRTLTLQAFDHFERLLRPKFMIGIKTQLIDEYVAKRSAEGGRRKGDHVSPATVNKELRHLRAALRIAGEWGYLPAVPRFRMMREPLKLPTYVSPEHFAAMYAACDKATMPEGQGYTAADWWRALLVMAYMTGWRISELLAADREDLDLEAGRAVTRAEDNKGKRDEMTSLHPVVVEHLRKVANFGPKVLPWNHNARTLYSEFARIQEAAGIKLPCRREHEHTRYCNLYGFHDLRRAFATMNADRLTADALQKLMRHKSYLTTKRYINMTRQMDQAVAALHVPDVLSARASG